MKPSKPTMKITEVAQPSNGIITNLIFLKINQSVNIIKTKTPTPNTIISFLIKLIISLAIIGIPPK